MHRVDSAAKDTTVLRVHSISWATPVCWAVAEAHVQWVTIVPRAPHRPYRVQSVPSTHKVGNMPSNSAPAVHRGTIVSHRAWVRRQHRATTVAIRIQLGSPLVTRVPPVTTAQMLSYRNCAHRDTFVRKAPASLSTVPMAQSVTSTVSSRMPSADRVPPGNIARVVS